MTTDATPLLSVQHLQIDFGGARPAVIDVNVTVAAGEIVALVGESGSGKSMTARATLGLLPRTARTSGSIRLAGTELLEAAEGVLDQVRGTRVALVFQEPQSALNPVRTVGWQIREALLAHGSWTRAQARSRAVELLEQVEIPEPEKRIDAYPHQLSGGQKQRVAIALALAGEPEVLLADEPTTALDVTVQAEILALLDRLRRERGMAILLITHNMGVVAQYADRVVVLRHGLVVEEGQTAALFAAPQHPYTRQLLGAVPAMPEPGLHEPETDRPERRTDRPVVLAYQGAGVRFGGSRGLGGHRALEEISLDLRAGEVLGVVGESGSGKTTLGRMAVGLVAATEGRVCLDGVPIGEMSAADLRTARGQVAFVHQDPAASLDPKMTVGASIREPLDIQGIGAPSERRDRAAELLAAVRLPVDFAERLPAHLSGGQRQRVALARALALRPRLLIADEPTSALDVSVQADVLDLFADLQAELGFACVFISHDLAVVHRVSHRVAVLRGGRLVEVGSADQVLGSPREPYTRALVDAVPVADPIRRLARLPQ